MSHIEILQGAREALSLSHADVAARIGINTPSYCDLESYEDELFMTLELAQIVRICQSLQITPRHLLSCPPAVPARQPEELKRVVIAYCQGAGAAVSEFEERAGWKIGAFLRDPQREFQKWCLAELRDVCCTLGLSYMEFLPR